MEGVCTSALITWFISSSVYGVSAACRKQIVNPQRTAAGDVPGYARIQPLSKRGLFTQSTCMF